MMEYNKKQCGTVKINLLVPVIGCAGFLFFGFMLILSLINSAGIFCKAVFGLLLFMSVCMILTLNQKIDYTPLGFIYRDMLGISHKYDYSDITKIRYSKDVWIKVKHRIILIDSMCTGGKKFARIAMQYSSNASVLTDRQSKLFNGNIKNPEEFIFIYALFFIMIILFGIWGIHFTKDIHLEDLSEISGTISDYTFDKHEDNHDRFSIRLSDVQNNFVTWQIDENSEKYLSLRKDIEDKKIFNVYFMQDDLNNDITNIYCLSCGDTVYVSLENENINNREIRRVILFFSGGCLFIWLLYIVISSYVMCNTEKYPRAVKLFVKEGYIISKNNRNNCKKHKPRQ